ncbi:hypothetical protein ACQY1Q_01930 [Tenacibaculum sp. TC6]|uniref:hypothetical protein n=1 Tax=Tenacibaculum sp. TC6 TaxID=3423223 RepID=UPI003D36B4B9
MNILIAISSGSLGFFLGTQLTEALLMVPYWKNLTSNDFFQLHETYGNKIYRFFAPITIIATIIPLVTAILIIQSSNTFQWTALIMGTCTLGFFITYFVYFKRANKNFANRSIHDNELPYALKKWEYWHWTRISLESIAFLCSLFLLIKN